MGSWGITERESDYGLDLLGTIAATKLKAANFATFNVAEAIDVITAALRQVATKEAMSVATQLMPPTL